MDRAELILDIFATRARTHEARMQVELAQLQYLLPRLRRMWIHLSRIRGGIGLRGPGETQLETDRRLIGTRIAELRRKLRGVARAQAVQRRRREGSFRVALVGYTNAGKSSLLEALSGSKQFVEDRLFATLDASTRLVEVGGGHEVPRHRYRRIHPQAPAPSDRVLPVDPRGSSRGGRAAPRDRPPHKPI